MAHKTGAVRSDFDFCDGDGLMEPVRIGLICDALY